MDCSPPGSSIHGVLQARILEWVALLQGIFLTQRLNPCVLCWQGSSLPLSCWESLMMPFWVVPHCSFDLHFSNNEQCWTSFHVFVGCLYVFFGEISVLGLLPIFFIFCLLFFFFSIDWCRARKADSGLGQEKGRRFLDPGPQLALAILIYGHPLDLGAFLVAQTVKNLHAMWETWVWSLGWEDLPEKGTGNPLQYSGLENPMDRGARQATVHGVSKSRTWLSDFLHFHFSPDLRSLVLLWRFPFPSGWVLQLRPDAPSLGLPGFQVSCCQATSFPSIQVTLWRKDPRDPSEAGGGAALAG